jgi:hypothetical protein
LPGSRFSKRPFFASDTGFTLRRKCGFFSDRKPRDNDVAKAQMPGIFCSLSQKKKNLDFGGHGADFADLLQGGCT